MGSGFRTFRCSRNNLRAGRFRAHSPCGMISRACAGFCGLPLTWPGDRPALARSQSRPAYRAQLGAGGYADLKQAVNRYSVRGCVSEGGYRLLPRATGLGAFQKNQGRASATARQRLTWVVPF